MFIKVVYQRGYALLNLNHCILLCCIAWNFLDIKFGIKFGKNKWLNWEVSVFSLSQRWNLFQDGKDPSLSNASVFRRQMINLMRALMYLEITSSSPITVNISMHTLMQTKCCLFPVILSTFHRCGRIYCIRAVKMFVSKPSIATGWYWNTTWFKEIT